MKCTLLSLIIFTEIILKNMPEVVQYVVFMHLFFYIQCHKWYDNCLH